MSGGRLEVRVDAALCLGSQSCVRRAPGAFETGADGKARVRDSEGEPEERVLAAARACPSFAIAVARGGKDLL